MDPTNFTVAVSDTQLAKQIGNTMSVNVVERLLARILPAAGLVKHGILVGRWENGAGAKQLSETIGQGFKDRLRPFVNRKSSISKSHITSTADPVVSTKK